MGIDLTALPCSHSEPHAVAPLPAASPAFWGPVACPGPGGGPPVHWPGPTRRGPRDRELAAADAANKLHPAPERTGQSGGADGGSQ
jgi:hypothetical protein